MNRVPPVLILIALFVLLLLAMRWGWVSKGRRQASIPAPLPLSDHELTERVAVGPYSGVYVSTVLTGQPLERVVAHGLGAQSPVAVSIAEDGSWRFDRTGAPSFRIALDQIHEIGTEKGQVGKFMTGHGLTSIRWTPSPGETTPDATRTGQIPETPMLTTAVRLNNRQDHNALMSWKENS